jgi:hypothetical protein
MANLPRDIGVDGPTYGPLSRLMADGRPLPIGVQFYDFDLMLGQISKQESWHLDHAAR